MTKDICVNPTQTVTSLENKTQKHFSAWDAEKSWVPTPPLQDSVILWSNTGLAPSVRKRGVKKGQRKRELQDQCGFFSIFWAKLWLSIALRPVKNCKFTQPGHSDFGLVCKTQSDPWKCEDASETGKMPQRELLSCNTRSYARAGYQEHSRIPAPALHCKMWTSCYFSTQYLRKSWSLKWAGKGKRKKWTGEGGNIGIWFFKAVHFAVLERCVASNTHDGIKPSWLVGTGHKILQHKAFILHVNAL